MSLFHICACCSQDYNVTDKSHQQTTLTLCHVLRTRRGLIKAKSLNNKENRYGWSDWLLEPMHAHSLSPCHYSSLPRMEVCTHQLTLHAVRVLQ